MPLSPFPSQTPRRFPEFYVLNSIFFLALLSPGLSAPAREPGNELTGQRDNGSEATHDFLETYCLDCHDTDTEKGEREFETLTFPLTDEHGLIAVQEIIDQLVLEEMPPPKKAKKLPAAAERAAAIASLTEIAATARETLQSTGGRTVLRRLNRREYLNTIEDLTGLNMVSFDPTNKFPRDQAVEHLDNIGDALRTSGYLLDQYLDAADAIIEKATRLKEKPEVRHWHFDKNFDQGQELSHSHGKVFNFRYLCVYEVPNSPNHEGGYAAISDFAKGVPHDGWYEITVQAHAMNRDHPYDPDIFRTEFAEPFRLGVVPGDHKITELHHPQPIEPQLAEVTIHDGDQPREYKMKVWLDAGQTPRFIFPNGMANCRSAFSEIARKYKDDWPKNDPYDGGIVDARRTVLQHGKMPHIRIHEVDIRGPLFEEWPPESQVALYGKQGFDPKRTREIIEDFANRAYRRPVDEEEIDRLMRLVAQRKQVGRSDREATGDALKAVLCSPAFLYLEPLSAETGNRKPSMEEISPHALAARLSYFLWSTMPDPALRALADSGEILEPEVLKSQARRLLADPRSEQFIRGFLDSWLNLRYLGEMPPDRDAFASYYSKDLERAFRTETELFTRHLIETDGPLTDFLDSDYSFLNKALAEHYELHDLADNAFDPATAHEFQKVSLQGNPRRGGLLGMGSVLTVTANGIETSPVIRGVWLLENILGTPPNPPPDDVPPIDPDIRGATTIREQLEKHRQVETCNECHRKIDPPGFALENFDPVGHWRKNYPKGDDRKDGPKIDASSELPSGEKFEDIIGFKKLLLEEKRVRQFSRALTEKLLAYATGRRIEPLDLPAAHQIADANPTLRALIEAVVLSDLFRSS